MNLNGKHWARKDREKEQEKKSSFDTDEFFEAAVMRGWEEKEPPKTAGNNEGVKAKAEALKKQLTGG